MPSAVNAAAGVVRRMTRVAASSVADASEIGCGLPWCRSGPRGEPVPAQRTAWQIGEPAAASRHARCAWATLKELSDPLWRRRCVGAKSDETTEGIGRDEPETELLRHRACSETGPELILGSREASPSGASSSSGPDY
jgi:hypothetical protein